MAVDGGSSSLKESGWLAAPQHAHTQKSMTQIAHAISVQGEDGGAAAAAGAWKWAIRNRIWDLLERENIAHFPRPVHHRIPNFVGAAAAAAKLASLPAFQAAKCVKVCPDSPQKQVRFLVLTGRKKLLTPQPRLRTGFFSELEAVALPGGALHEACTPAGAAKYGKPLGLDARIKVDLIVIGSVAVDPKTGARLGKGEGFAELEYGMLRYMGAIDDSTLVATSGNIFQEMLLPCQALVVFEIRFPLHSMQAVSIMLTKASCPFHGFQFMINNLSMTSLLRNY
eukprot:c24092_g1_i2 orf=235-1080(+)